MLNKLKTFISKQPRKVLIREVIIALILLSMPFWFIVIDYVPNVEEISIGYFSIKSLAFHDLNVMMWVITLKFIPLITLLIWFFTCKHWWRFTILVPIIFVISQLANLFATNRYMDKDEFWIALVFSAPIIIVLLWLSNKINSYSYNLVLSNEVKIEIKKLLEILEKEKSNDLISFLDQFKKIKMTKVFVDDDTYLSNLILLRNQIINKK